LALLHAVAVEKKRNGLVVFALKVLFIPIPSYVAHIAISFFWLGVEGGGRAGLMPDRFSKAIIKSCEQHRKS